MNFEYYSIYNTGSGAELWRGNAEGPEAALAECAEEVACGTLEIVKLARDPEVKVVQCPDWQDVRVCGNREVLTDLVCSQFDLAREGWQAEKGVELLLSALTAWIEDDDREGAPMWMGDFGAWRGGSCTSRGGRDNSCDLIAHPAGWNSEPGRLFVDALAAIEEFVDLALDEVKSHCTPEGCNYEEPATLSDDAEKGADS